MKWFIAKLLFIIGFRIKRTEIGGSDYYISLWDFQERWLN